MTFTVWTVLKLERGGFQATQMLVLKLGQMEKMARQILCGLTELGSGASVTNGDWLNPRII